LVKVQTDFPKLWKKYSDKSLESAREWFNSLDANMGGTEILAPIKFVYNSADFKKQNGCHSDTDGEGWKSKGDLLILC
jgi:hypothetical protein